VVRRVFGSRQRRLCFGSIYVRRSAEEKKDSEQLNDCEAGFEHFNKSYYYQQAVRLFKS